MNTKRALYELTPTEARVAEMLLEGLEVSGAGGTNARHRGNARVPYEARAGQDWRATAE